MFRYVTVVWNANNPAQLDTARSISGRLIKKNTVWKQVHRSAGLAVFCADIHPGSMDVYPLPCDGGVVLGTLFERCVAPDGETPASYANFSEDEAKRLLDTQGRRLVDAYWGNYVAFLNDAARGSKWAAKDPTGTLPCMWVEHAGVHLFFSCIEDCMALDVVRFTVNWAYVADNVARGWTNGEIPPLNELHELTRGECIGIDARSNKMTQRQLYWKPSTFVDSPGPMEDARIAATALRQTVRHCVRSWAACHKSLVLRLSGGLDSSIVLGCLRGAGSATRPAVTCVTYYGTTAGADPRPWARMAAVRVGVEHVEVPVNAALTPLDALLDAAPTPAPAGLLTYYLARRNYGDVVHQRAATAIFTGDGGDSGFGSMSIGRAIDESLQRQGFGLHTLRLAAAIAAYRDSTTARVLIDALRRLAFGTKLNDNARLFEKLGQLASPELRKGVLVHDRLPHPWLRDVAGVPWGLIYRLGMLLMRPEFYDPFAAPAEPQVVRIHPLQSQPVVELCLRIPLYVHFLEGRDRGLARTAFTADVPEKILRRQWKDRGRSSMSELVTRNLAFLRTLLMDGILVREGLLDRSGIDDALSPTPTKQPGDLSVILHYMQIEVWVRQWTGQTLTRAV